MLLKITLKEFYDAMFNYPNWTSWTDMIDKDE